MSQRNPACALLFGLLACVPGQPDESGDRSRADSGTDSNGAYSFSTIKPGAVPGPNGKPQAPHILVAVFARGLPRHAYTRIYFPDEASNTNDQILTLVPADRRATLLAKREDRNGAAVYVFDIRLQGENETVFFDV